MSRNKTLRTWPQVTNLGGHTERMTPIEVAKIVTLGYLVIHTLGETGLSAIQMFAKTSQRTFFH
jgi:hypothetical protein